MVLWMLASSLPSSLLNHLILFTTEDATDDAVDVGKLSTGMVYFSYLQRHSNELRRY
jgi:hypothetical protein